MIRRLLNALWFVLSRKIGKTHPTLYGEVFSNDWSAISIRYFDRYVVVMICSLIIATLTAGRFHLTIHGREGTVMIRRFLNAVGFVFSSKPVKVKPAARETVVQDEWSGVKFRSLDRYSVVDLCSVIVAFISFRRYRLTYAKGRTIILK
ncbi:MAG: hypothetical protein KAJ73_00610 [Zetaproteobacteria bacterium]|nr:hypothetical protein [Zetaproteobacteria bacterium]